MYQEVERHTIPIISSTWVPYQVEGLCSIDYDEAMSLLTLIV